MRQFNASQAGKIARLRTLFGEIGWPVRVERRFNKYYPTRGYKKSFKALSTKANVATVAKRVVDIVKKLRDE